MTDDVSNNENILMNNESTLLAQTTSNFQLFSRLARQNCLIFGTKVNLDNTYILEIFILFGKFLIPSNPP